MITGIVTNEMARKQGQQTELQRTRYAIEAHKAMLQDRINQTSSDLVKQAFAIAIIELTELQRTLEKK